MDDKSEENKGPPHQFSPQFLGVLTARVLRTHKRVTIDGSATLSGRRTNLDGDEPPATYALSVLPLPLSHPLRDRNYATVTGNISLSPFAAVASATDSPRFLAAITPSAEISATSLK